MSSDPVSALESYLLILVLILMGCSSGSHELQGGDDTLGPQLPTLTASPSPSSSSTPTPTDANFTKLLGGDVFRAQFDEYESHWKNGTLSVDHMPQAAHACSAFVNAYRLTNEPAYLSRALEIADFLAANSNLDGDDYAGWGPRDKEESEDCPERSNFQVEDLWDTGVVLNCLLKSAEVDTTEKRTRLVTLARNVVDNWPYIGHIIADDAFGAGGVRYYRRSTDTCATPYVKNTNIALAISLFRLHRLTGIASYETRAQYVLNSELWEILSQKNFGYYSMKSSRSMGGEHFKGATVLVEGEIHCAPTQQGCWNHLPYEAFALYQIQLITGQDLTAAINAIMRVHRSSRFGNPEEFDWSAGFTTTPLIYNCFLRPLSNTPYSHLCQSILNHDLTGNALIFYSMVSEGLLSERE